jgi:hypothetical protein
MQHFQVSSESRVGRLIGALPLILKALKFLKMVHFILGFYVSLKVMRWFFGPAELSKLLSWNPLYSLLSYLNRIDLKKSQHFESCFQNTPYQPLPYIRGHSHGQSAAARGGGLGFMKSLGMLTGLRPYDVQASNQSENSGLLGCRTYVWPKDFDKKARNDDPDEAGFFCMIDVDQYLHMPWYLSEKPLVLYTMQPKKPADTMEEMMFTVEPDNTFKTIVRGGAVYRHQIWNYSSDTVTHTAMLPKSCFELPFRTVVYRVMKRDVNEHWSIVALVPRASYGLIGTLVIKTLGIFTDSFHSLRRLSPVQMIGEVPFASIRNVSNDQHTVSVAVANGEVFSSQTYESTTFDSLLTYCHRETQHNLHSISQRLTNPKLTASSDAASFVHSAIKPEVVTDGFKTPFYSVPTDDLGKPAMLKIMPEIVLDGAYVPLKNQANYDHAIEERVTKVRSYVKMDNQCLGWIKEALDKFFPRNLVPVEAEVVIAKFHEARQRRALIDGIENFEDKGPDSAFMKAEPYMKDSPPRIITTAKPCHKVRWSRYQLAFGDWLKLQPWYAFGLTPLEIANRVAEICTTAQKSVEIGDYNKMDGHTSEFVRFIERTLFHHIFHPSYHEEIDQCMKQNHGKPVQFGETLYEGEFIRKSGDPETSNFNSAINKFINYCALRFLGYSCEDAWNHPGVYGGDDSLTPDMDPAVLEKMSLRFGQEIKSQTVLCGALGVNFLGRYYGDGVWEGVPDSICNLPRTLGKFHLTVNLPQQTPFAKERRAQEKAMAYILMDASTPYLGNICKAILSRKCLVKKVDLRNVTWWAQFDKKDQFPNRFGDWMMDYLSFWGIDSLGGRANGLVQALREQDWDCLDYEPLWQAPFVVSRERVVNGEIVVPVAAAVETKGVAPKRKEKRADYKARNSKP